MKYFEVKSQLFVIVNQELKTQRFNPPYSTTPSKSRIRNYDIISSISDLDLFFQVQIGRKKTNFIKCCLENRIGEILVTNEMNQHYLSEVQFYKSEFNTDKTISPIVHYLEGPMVESLDDLQLDSAIVENLFVQIKSLNLNQKQSQEVQISVEKIKAEFKLEVQIKNSGVNYVENLRITNQSPILKQKKHPLNSKSNPKYLTSRIPIDNLTFSRFEEIYLASQMINEELRKQRINKR